MSGQALNSVSRAHCFSFVGILPFSSLSPLVVSSVLLLMEKSLCREVAVAHEVHGTRIRSNDEVEAKGKRRLNATRSFSKLLEPTLYGGIWLV